MVHVDRNRDADNSILARHWPAYILVLLLALMIGTWPLIPTESENSLVRLLQSTIPNLLAVVLVALILYIFLNRDTTRRRASDAVQGKVTDSGSKAVALEAIDQKLGDIATSLNFTLQPSILLPRSQLPLLNDLFSEAKEAAIVVTSGLGLINHHYGLFQDLLQRNIGIRVVLLDPDVAEAMTIWDRQSNPPMGNPEQDIRQGIRLFRQLEADDPRCRVLLTDVVSPYSLVCAFDGAGGGRIQAEFLLFRAPTDRRPHIVVTSDESSPWFQLYRTQLEACVKHAEIHSARLPNSPA